MAVQSGMYTDDLVDTIGKAITGGENFGTMMMIAPLAKEEEEGRRVQNEFRYPELREQQLTTNIYCIIIATTATYTTEATTTTAGARG